MEKKLVGEGVCLKKSDDKYFVAYPHWMIEKVLEDPFRTMEGLREFLILIENYSSKREKIRQIFPYLDLPEYNAVMGSFDNYQMENFIMKHIKKCVFECLSLAPDSLVKHPLVHERRLLLEQEEYQAALKDEGE